MSEHKFNITDMLQLTSTYCHLAGVKIFKNYIDMDITLEQFGIVYLLYYKDGLYQSQVANLLNKDRPNITRMVDILEKKNYLKRKKDEENKRIQKLYITENGKSVVEKIVPLRDDFYKKMTEGFLPDEIETLCISLHKLRDNIKKHYGITLFDKSD